MTIKQMIFKNLFMKGIISLLVLIISRSSRILAFNWKNHTNKILIISIHKLGDTVLTLPALSLFNKYFTQEISILCFNDAKTIYENFIPGLNYILINKNDLYCNNRLVKSNLRKKIKKLSPDKVIDLTGSIASATLLFNCKSQEIIGINEYVYRSIYNHFISIRQEPHLVDIYLDVFKSFTNSKYEKVKRDFEINFNPNSRILIHPFAGWRAKEWGLNKFISLCEILNKKYDCSLIFEKGKLNSDILNELDKKSLKIIETNNVPDLIQELNNCALFISNDSGPVHIASMIGKPTFGIFGPTNPSFHVPIGNKHFYTNKTLNCSPIEEKYCYTFGGRFCPTYDCMRNLSVEEVVQQVIKSINELGINIHK